MSVILRSGRVGLLRIALLPEERLWELVSLVDKHGFESLHSIFDSGLLRAALVLASPSLDHALMSNNFHKTADSLLRYLIRAGTRATPFGLFASCNLVNFAFADNCRFTLVDSSIVLNSYPEFLEFHRSFKVDARSNFNDHLWISSPSSYGFMGTIRCLSAGVRDGETCSLSIIDSSSTISAVLAFAEKPATGAELLSFLRQIDPVVGDSEVNDFVLALIELGFLVEYSMPHTLSSHLFLKQEVVDMRFIDESTLADLRAYCRCSVSKRLSIDAELDSMFEHDLKRAASVLRSLRSPPTSPLSAFTKAFSARFEGQAIPLLEALDDEIGIGLDGSPRHPFGTFEAITTSEQDHLISGNDSGHPFLHPHLLELYSRALSTGIFHQEINVDALSDCFAPWPSSMAAILQLNKDSEIYVDTIVGPSSMKMLARFAPSDPELLNYLLKLSEHEVSQCPDAIHAEVCYCPNDKSLNAVVRPSLYSHRIVLNGSWDPTDESDIPVNQLYLVLRRARLFLIHGPSGKEVIPHVTHAANPVVGDWPFVHRFLSLLEPDVSFESLRFDWSYLSSAKHLPRISLGRIILSLEQWMISGLSSMSELENWLDHAHIPGRIDLLIENQTPLALDLTMSCCRRILLNALREYDVVRVRERWPAGGNSVVCSDEGSFAHELVYPLFFSSLRTNSLSSLAGVSSLSFSEFSDSRVFRSSWLCFHIGFYPSGIGRLLVECLRPLLRRLSSTYSLKRFYFVRAYDPTCHLRVRFLFSSHEFEDRARSLLRDLLYQANVPPAAFSEVPYVSEMWRYGSGSSLSFSEQFFELDSYHAIDLLECLGPDATDAQLIFAASLSCIAIVSSFSLGDLLLAADICQSAMSAYGVPPQAQIGTLSRSFRQFMRGNVGSWPRQRIDFLLRLNQIYAERIASEFSPGLWELFDDRRKREGLIVSFMHMACNRIFRFSPNRHEPYVYGLSRRFLRSSVSAGFHPDPYRIFCV